MFYRWMFQYCLGAGKTTTINVLTGLFPPTHGSAFVYGHSVKDDVPELQKIMGVCPQHVRLIVVYTGFTKKT